MHPQTAIIPSSSILADDVEEDEGGKMTKECREQLEAAMTDSFMENVGNGPTSAEDFLRDILRDGRLGYAQMDDSELLDAAKADIGYSPEEEYPIGEDNSSTEALRNLGRLIRKIEVSGTWRRVGSIRRQELRSKR
jgi:hypothetical protein